MKKHLLLIALFFSVSFCFAQTIAEIQGTGNASPFVDQVVTTTGVVTAAGNAGYFIQDGTDIRSGVYVFDNTQSPAVGDEITITASVTEYFDLTELKDISAYTVVSSGNTIGPLELTAEAAQNEDYESMLVRITDATCTNIDLGYGEWEVNDGSAALAINDVFYLHTPVIDEVYNIIGIVNYSFGAFKLEPRSAEDVSEVVRSKEYELQQILTLSPNPVSSDLTIEVPEKGNLQLFTSQGSLLLERSVEKGTLSISLIDYPAGLYYFNLNDYVGKVTKI